MPITPAQCRAARALIGLDQADLAKRANVSRNVIVDFEKGRRTPTTNNLAAIRGVLESAGVEFIEENGGGPGVRLGPYSVTLSRPSGSNEPGAFETPRHFVRKEDAIAMARDWLRTAKQNGEVGYSARLGFWHATTGERSEQRLRLSGPLGGAPNELNLEFNIQPDEE